MTEKAMTEKGGLAKQPPIGFDHTSKRWTAKAPGLTIPQSLLLRADEVTQ